MDKESMKRRTKQFALQVIQLVESLPPGRTAEVIARQLLRSGTSVGANYRAACRAKSTRDFIYKLGMLKRRPTSQFIGWKCWLMPESLQKTSRLL